MGRVVCGLPSQRDRTLRGLHEHHQRLNNRIEGDLAVRGKLVSFVQQGLLRAAAVAAEADRLGAGLSLPWCDSAPWSSWTSTTITE